VVAPEREALGVGQRLLEFGGQFVHAHEGIILASGILFWIDYCDGMKLFEPFGHIRRSVSQPYKSCRRHNQKS
jgi:hypothetical protein